MSNYLKIKTSLDSKVSRERKFVVKNLTGEEGLCRDFKYTLEVVSADRLTEGQFDKLVGDQITVSIEFVGIDVQKGQRYINGIVHHVKELGISRTEFQTEVWHYQLTICSWLSVLQQVKDCRIFQKNSNTALSIVTDLLKEAGLFDYEIRTRNNSPRRSYVTQYNETTYNFILRLLQGDGILWRFEHKENQHLLIFFDDIAQLPESGSSNWGISEGITELHYQTNHIPVEACQLTDFDYENPPAKTVNSPSSVNQKRFKHFVYPGDFESRKDGETKVSRLNKSISNEARRYKGASTVRSLSSGAQFPLQVPQIDNLENRKFFITELFITANENTYENEFTAFDTKTEYVYPQSQLVDKPVVHGVQTAVVSGSKNNPDKSMTDKEGRILVRFHWDHHTPKNEIYSSAYIRNAVTAAGEKRGFIFTPKIGDEVIVSFLEGDIDRPIITGRLYAIDQSLPIATDKTPYVSVIKPHGSDGANSVLFDDSSGSELFEITAKKDMDVKVGTDLKIEVEDELTIMADNFELTANGGILTGNVITLSGGDINSVTGKTISNTTGLIVADLVAGLENNKAGANILQLAIGMVKSQSGGATLSAAPVIFNTTATDVDFQGEGGVKNLGLIMANVAGDMISNSASKEVSQKSDLVILTKTKNETNDFEKSQTTQALMVKDEGEVVINDG